MSVQRTVKFDGGLTARKAHKIAAIPTNQPYSARAEIPSRDLPRFTEAETRRLGRVDTDYKLNLGYTPTPAVNLLTSRFALKRSNALVRGVAVLACGGPSQETAN